MIIKKILKALFPYSWSGDGSGNTKQDGFISLGAGLAIAGAATAAGGMAAAGAAEKGTRQARADLAPFKEAGLGALGRYEELLRDPSRVRETPGYQFRLQEGLEGVMGRGSAVSKLFSGETGKGLMEYGQQYATAEYDKSLQREFSLAQMGQASAAGQAQAAQTGAGQVASAYGQIGEGLGGMGSAYSFGKYLEK